MELPTVFLCNSEYVQYYYGFLHPQTENPFVNWGLEQKSFFLCSNHFMRVAQPDRPLHNLNQKIRCFCVVQEHWSTDF